MNRNEVIAELLDGDYRRVTVNEKKSHYVIYEQSDACYLYTYPYCEIVVNGVVFATCSGEATQFPEEYTAICLIFQNYYDKYYSNVKPIKLEILDSICSDDYSSSKTLFVTEANVYYELFDGKERFSKQISYEEANKIYKLLRNLRQ